jgi:hypothetical protein
MRWGLGDTFGKGAPCVFVESLQNIDATYRLLHHIFADGPRLRFRVGGSLVGK